MREGVRRVGGGALTQSDSIRDLANTVVSREPSR